MKVHMQLSIIIVNWNTREMSRSCLESVFENIHDYEAEVIVVDNASKDGSAEMVKNDFPEAILICNSENMGFATANNQAIRIAKGRNILLLNSDTIVLGDVMQKSVVYMDAHPEVGVFGCRVLNPDRTMQATCFQYPSLFNSFLKTLGMHRIPWPAFFGRESLRGWKRDSERDVDVVTGCYFMVRAEDLKKVGLLDESYFFCYEETDWCVRFRKLGWRCRFSPVGEIIHYGNVSGKMLEHKRDLHLIRGKIKLHRKHGGELNAATIWLLCLIFFVIRLPPVYLGTLFSSNSDLKLNRTRMIKVLRNFPGVR